MHRIQINYGSNKPSNSQSAQQKKIRHDENEIKVIELYMDSLKVFFAQLTKARCGEIFHL
jgi:hypothetical protein